MALTRADVETWADLARNKLVPARPRVLEIGQANWYGDVPPPAGCDDPCPFKVARKWYKQVLDYASITALDFHGPDAVRADLNGAVSLEGVFDVVINTGTSEHVFDQRRLFETVHDFCEPGGLMVHAVPCGGWEDHGLYTYQPCFFRDLAAANGYLGLSSNVWSFGERSPDRMLYVVMKKTRPGPFRVPIQGKYRSPGVTKGLIAHVATKEPGII